MKLRNKKTGKIFEFDSIGFRKERSDGREDFIVKGNSLTALNEEWEDYEQKEPLIKDEKLRDILRAWAKAQVIDEVIFDDYWKSFRLGNLTISAWGNRLELEDGKTYTIEELCGNEEE